MSSKSAIPLLIVIAAFIAFSVAAFLWASGPSYQVLFSNISEADGGAILAELDRRAVPYKFSASGQAIMVPSDVVHPLRLQLAEQGLPKGGSVGFELLDNQAFGVSQFTEQINYQRGLEGELGRSMESLGPVASARVHLAMAKPSVFVQQRAPAKASVILNLHNGRSLSDTQVNAIVHLIASSVADLTADNVSIVDQRGELLSRPRGALAGLDNTQLRYTEDIETSMQQRVANILSPILGKDNFRVQVNAQVDFSTVEETQEAFSPNKNSELAAIRSSQFSSNFSGDEDAARGVPGALSNTAPSWAPSPIDSVEGDGEGEGAAGGDTASKANLQRDETVNYELDRNIRHIRHQRGALERLSVAVVVNDRPAVDEEGNPTLEPVSDEELGEISRLVQQAVGFSAERGDRVEVINSPFQPVLVPEIPPMPWWQNPMLASIGPAALRWIAVGVLVLLGYRRVVRPLMTRHLGVNYIAGGNPVAALPGTGNVSQEAGGAAGYSGEDGEDGENSAIPFKRVDKSGSYAQQLAELKKISEDDPRMISMIVRNWIKEDA